MSLSVKEGAPWCPGPFLPNDQISKTWLRGKFSKTAEAYFKSCLVIFQVLLIPSAGAEATFPPVLVGVKINGGNFTHGVVAVPGMSDVVLQCIAIGATSIQWRRLVTQDLQKEWNINADGSVITLQLNTTGGGTQNYSRFEGTYECVASNHKGLALSSPIRLIIPCIKTDYPPGTVAPVKNVYWNVGSLVIVQCNTSPVTFHPDMATVIYPRRIVWFFTNTTIDPLGNSFLRLELPNVLPSSVIAYDGTLIIRRQLSIEMLIHKELECRIATPTANDGLYNLEISLGTYFPSIGSTSFSNAPGQSITLAYKSNDVIVLRGGICSIICVFDDPGNSIQNVSWSKLTGEPLQPDLQYFPGGMAKLGILNAQYRHSGIYSCSYPGTNEMGRIEVQVIRYPSINSSLLKDYYAVVGSTATLVCLVDSAADAGFIWKYNDRTLFNDKKFRARPISQLQSVLTIANLTLQDTGVVNCLASNKWGTTARSIRLIVYNPPSVFLSNMDNDSDTIYLDTVQYINLNCTYTLDEQASLDTAVFQFAQRYEYVTANTDDRDFGLVRPSVEKFADRSYLLIFSVSIETIKNQKGNCTCIVQYTILNEQLNASSNALHLKIQSDSKTPSQQVNDADSKTPSQQVNDADPSSTAAFLEQHWWLGIIAFSVAVIAIVVAVNLVYKRRRRSTNPTLNRQATSQTAASANVSPNPNRPAAGGEVPTASKTSRASVISVTTSSSPRNVKPPQPEQKDSTIGEMKSDLQKNIKQDSANSEKENDAFASAVPSVTSQQSGSK